jgi:hypothetical protein
VGKREEIHTPDNCARAGLRGFCAARAVVPVDDDPGDLKVWHSPGGLRCCPDSLLVLAGALTLVAGMFVCMRRCRW